MPWWNTNKIGPARSKFHQKYPNWKHWIRPRYYPGSPASSFPGRICSGQDQPRWMPSDPTSDESYYVPYNPHGMRLIGRYFIVDNGVNLSDYHGYIGQLISYEKVSSDPHMSFLGSHEEISGLSTSTPQGIPESWIKHLHIIPDDFTEIIGWKAISLPSPPQSPLFRLIGKF